MQYKQQYDSSDCGTACIAMIASHFGKTPNIVDFVKSDKKENLLLKFIPVFLPHKKLLFYSLLSSLLLLAFGIISSFYYKYMFDEVLYSKAKFSLHTLSFGVLLVVVVQSESR